MTTAACGALRKVVTQGGAVSSSVDVETGEASSFEQAVNTANAQHAIAADRRSITRA
ncbi:MAG: hypothetical protein ABMA25_18320 [Ilumatobacteraceae bacterium]